MVHPEVRPVRTELFGRYREVDGLQQGIRGRPVRECGEGVQWPNDKKPIRFIISQTRRRALLFLIKIELIAVRAGLADLGPG